MKVISVIRHVHYIRYLRFYNYHWVDLFGGRLLVPEGITLPEVSVSALP